MRHERMQLSRRGRPKDPVKRTALIAAARQLFLAKGVDVATMEEIATHAKVSKATLYANFADRSALLEAVIRTESQRVTSDDYPEEAKALGLETTLRHFGLRLLTFLTDPQRVEFDMLIAGATKQRPELARRFFEAGPGRGRAALVRLIATGVRQGILAIEDPLEAAGDLLGLWQGFTRIEATFRYRNTPGREELRKRAARGVRLFMRLYAPSTPASRPTTKRRGRGC
ncbi:MAG TPA: TetR/AcrR family transcriptional regulator [Steroidobacteraceae bacterium]